MITNIWIQHNLWTQILFPPFFGYTTNVCRFTRAWLRLVFELPSNADLLGEWWLKSRDVFQESLRPSFDSLFMLICWRIWRK
ncbi:hypothetical protein GUJ93_ZPchr0012g19497 [Zizania palustris]|uniref:Uncharacterized protein n=1 Tax=Zizania palustris TaxID=103762 RepID=A0A8J6BQA0_ZIZPA|nr:hypothetical protein GUJ93_ZPchr0012g19497 [Zizania palustris]